MAHLKGFLLNTVRPSTPGSDWFVLESLDLRGQARPALRLGFDWGHKPFVLENIAGDEAGAIVERQVFLSLGVGLNIANRLRLALDMPVRRRPGGRAGDLGGIAYPDPEGSALGDMRATADVRAGG